MSTALRLFAMALNAGIWTRNLQLFARIGWLGRPAQAAERRLTRTLQEALREARETPEPWQVGEDADRPAEAVVPPDDPLTMTHEGYWQSAIQRHTPYLPYTPPEIPDLPQPQGFEARDAQTGITMRFVRQWDVQTDRQVQFINGTPQWIGADQLYGHAPVMWPTHIPRRGEAADRAQTLLKSLLTPSQLADYEKTGGFTMTGQSGTFYRLSNRRTIFNVEDATYRYCVHLSDYSAPLADQIVAQMMTLRFQEAYFLQTANRDRHYQVPEWTQPTLLSRISTAFGRATRDVWAD